MRAAKSAAACFSSSQEGSPDTVSMARRFMAPAQLASFDRDGYLIIPGALRPDTVAGLLAGLLTTEEIGNGWVDQGRMVVPTAATGLPVAFL